jgi:hypothetical protein
MHIKALAVGGAALGGLLTLAALPAVLAPTAGYTGTNCGATVTASVEAIAATIRQLESGNNYTARASGSSASGAYQFVDGTWGGYGGYPRAYLAPPAVQDAKAAENINAILADHGGDPSAVPVSWFIGYVPPPGSPDWDIVPAPGAGNRFTPRQYQAKWMEIYREKLNGGAPTASAVSIADDPTADPAPPNPGCNPGSAFTVGDYALPVDRVWYDEHPRWFTKPHHDYPAADIPVPTGTPLYAMTSGVVTSLTASGKCGIGVILTGDDGAQYTYCHGLPGSHAVAAGQTVTAGQFLMSSASTGNSTGPHLHLGIRVAGVQRCPQQLLVAIAEGGTVSVSDLPTAGCSY